MSETHELGMQRLDFKAGLAGVAGQIAANALEGLALAEVTFEDDERLAESIRNTSALLRSAKSECEREERRARENDA